MRAEFVDGRIRLIIALTKIPILITVEHIISESTARRLSLGLATAANASCQETEEINATTRKIL